MPSKVLRIYRWEDAEPRYRELSQHGGDEDYVVVAYEDADADYWWLCANYVPMFGWPDYHEVDGELVVIYAHA